MQLDTALRLSFYATLAIACLALGYAELYFVPWMGAFAIVAVGVIVVAYRQEGRWALSEEVANFLGLFIGTASLTWIYFQLPRSEEDLVARGVPWPAGLLPHVGPLLMGSLLVKIFRPKRPGDFWSIQIIALMMVTLGCVLTGEVIFGALLITYFACVLWSLSLFYLSRNRSRCRNEPRGTFLAPADETQKFSWPIPGLRQAMLRAAVVVPLGFLLFLVAPRRTDSEWIPYRLSTSRDIMMRAGTPNDLDMNRVGKVELGEKRLFGVSVRDAKNEPAELAAGQRFRTNTFDNYRHGRWNRVYRAFSVASNETQIRLRANQELPDLGPKQLFFTFKVSPKEAGSFVLAEPVVLGVSPGDFPYYRLDGSMARNLFFELTGTGTLMPFPNPLRREYEYLQVARPTPACTPAPARHVSRDYIRYLLGQKIPPEIGAYTRRVIAQLNSLTDDERRLSATADVPLANQQKVAMALEQFFATSSEYGYTLNLRRANAAMDPTVDFLLNTKQGHCERFAGGLALMLRSVGIPSRLVAGFCDAEMAGAGEYEVREKNAHSWVEVVLADKDDPGTFSWLALDPTPTNELVDLSFFDWLTLNWHNSRTLWNFFVLEYDTERQLRAAELLWQYLQRPSAWVDVGALGFCVLCGLAGLKLWRRWQARQQRHDLAYQAVAPFYQRYLGVLARRCDLRPAAAQTPREFAHLAAAKLSSASAALAELPARIVALLYQCRYGGRALERGELAAIDREVAALDVALKQAATPS